MTITAHTLTATDVARWSRIRLRQANAQNSDAPQYARMFDGWYLALVRGDVSWRGSTGLAYESGDLVLVEPGSEYQYEGTGYVMAYSFRARLRVSLPSGYLISLDQPTDITTITAQHPATPDPDMLAIAAAWWTAAEQRGVRLADDSVALASYSLEEHIDAALIELDGTLVGDEFIGQVVGYLGRYYAIVLDVAVVRAVLMPVHNECTICGGEIRLGPETEVHYDEDGVCSDECGIVHVHEVADALRARGVTTTSIPEHFPTLWVHLADGSVLQVGDHEDNQRLHGGGGYCVVRDLDGVGIGGPENDGVVLGDRNATLDQLADFIRDMVEQVGEPRDVPDWAVLRDAEPTPTGVVVTQVSPTAATLMAPTGAVVRVEVRVGDDGQPEVVLAGVNCDLDGVEPARYTMVTG